MTKKKEEPAKDEISEEKLEEVSGGKLSIGKPNDKYEREADAVGDKVMEAQPKKDI
jgi:hypothetical protein